MERWGDDERDEAMRGTYALGMAILLMGAEALALLASVLTMMAWLGLIGW